MPVGQCSAATDTDTDILDTHTDIVKKAGPDIVPKIHLTCNQRFRGRSQSYHVSRGIVLS
jgi:hypothetical protein